MEWYFWLASKNVSLKGKSQWHAISLVKEQVVEVASFWPFAGRTLILPLHCHFERGKKIKTTLKKSVKYAL